jgi:hypothetical protein
MNFKKNLSILVVNLLWQEKMHGVELRASVILSRILYLYNQNLSVEKVFPEEQLDKD